MGDAHPARMPVADCADVNAAGEDDLSDAIHLRSFLFLGGPPPGKPAG
jgi:hypothetical protein